MDVLKVQLELALLRVSEESRFHSVVQADGAAEVAFQRESCLPGCERLRPQEHDFPGAQSDVREVVSFSSAISSAI